MHVVHKLTDLQVYLLANCQLSVHTALCRCSHYLVARVCYFHLAEIVHQVCSCISSGIMDRVEAKPADLSATVWNDRSGVWHATRFRARSVALRRSSNQMFARLKKSEIGWPE